MQGHISFAKNAMHKSLATTATQRQKKRGTGGITMAERNLVAISIKHTEYRWKFGMPCVLWGHRTKDDEERSFGGYTIYPNNAEIYSLKEWQESEYGAGDVCKVDTPVHMEINFCKKWKKYDTVLVPIDEYIGYCKCACLALDKPGMED